MELLVELIVDLILEGVLEFAVDGMESKKVPMPLRILAAVILFVLLIGVGVLFVFAGMAAESVVLRIFLGAIFFGLFGGLTWKVCKVFKKRRQ